jgi:quinol monooxygenase YgiN
MIAVIAHFTVKEGMNAAFEAASLDLVALVHAREPDTKVYQIAKDPKNPAIYKMLELYTDMDAFKLHGSTDYFKAAFPILSGFMAEPVRLDILETLG